MARATRAKGEFHPRNGHRGVVAEQPAYDFDDLCPIATLFESVIHLTFIIHFLSV
jgi:hypothetical protein